MTFKEQWLPFASVCLFAAVVASLITPSAALQIPVQSRAAVAGGPQALSSGLEDSGLGFARTLLQFSGRRAGPPAASSELPGGGLVLAVPLGVVIVVLFLVFWPAALVTEPSLRGPPAV